MEEDLERYSETYLSSPSGLTVEQLDLLTDIVLVGDFVRVEGNRLRGQFLSPNPAKHAEAFTFLQSRRIKRN